MEKHEFSKICAGLKAAYPREKMFDTPESLSLWHTMLKDIPYEVAAAAAQNWIASQKWPPSIAELREAALVMTQGEAPDWGEAWQKVQSLIHRYGFYRPDEAYAEMDELTRKTVEGVGGFRMLCSSENQVADRAKFEKLYEVTAKRQKEDMLIPAWLSEMSAGYKLNAEGRPQLEG